jgi:hypothetical protein
VSDREPGPPSGLQIVSPLNEPTADSVVDDRGETPISSGISPAFVCGLMVLSFAAYLLSPPFVISICHMAGIPWDQVRMTVYLPLVLFFGGVPGPWAMYYEQYCSFVIETLRLPVP